MRDEFDRSPIRVPPEVNMLPVGLGALRVMTALFRYANKAYECTVGRDALMRYLPACDVRNFRRSVRELVTGGFLEVRHNEDRRTGACEKNTYKAKLPSLQKLREQRVLDKSAPPCVKSTPSPVSKRVVPNKKQLKEDNWKTGNGKPRVKSGRGEGNVVHREALDALNFFRELYRRTLGREYPGSRWDMKAMVDLVRPGSYGLSSTKAACEMWFLSNAPWNDRAKACGYVLPGGAGGMEWHMEWITSLPSFDSRKQKHAREYAQP